MPPDQFKTQSIQILADSITAVRNQSEKLADRLGAVEVEQGKTVVHCKAINDKIDTIISDNEKKHVESAIYRSSLKKDIAAILDKIEPLKIEDTIAKTRWAMIGKPIWTALLGGGAALALKVLIDHINK